MSRVNAEHYTYSKYPISIVLLKAVIHILHLRSCYGMKHSGENNATGALEIL